MGDLKKYFADSSALSLLFSNILIIILALAQKWEISIILWVYWMQSIIIGFFQTLRILSLRRFSTVFGIILGQSTLVIFLLIKALADLFMHNAKHAATRHLLKSN